MFRYFIFSIIVFTVSLVGCSGGFNSVAPCDLPQDEMIVVADVPSDSVVRGDLSLGIWEVIVDTNTLEADYHMVRGASAIGQSLPECLLNTYLTSTPCSTCMRMDVVKLEPSTNRLTLSIGIRHPLPAFNGALPVTAANRADLDVFNVIGIVILPKVDTNFNYQLEGSMPIQTDPFTMVNPDGYTHSLYTVVTDPTFINPSYAEPISNLNPYKEYFASSPNRRFAQGEPFLMIDYEFDTSKVFNFLRFYIAFRASYGQSATFAKTIENVNQSGSRKNPLYFIPEFNQIEAYDVEIEQSGTIGWKNTASTANITVRCKDYQAGKTGLNRYLVEYDPLDAVSYTSDVGKVLLDIPVMNATPFETATPVSGTGTPSDPYVFSLTIQNNLGASFGTYPFFAIIEDTRSQNPIHAYKLGNLRIPYIDEFDPWDDTLGWKKTTYRGDGWALVDVGGGYGNVWDESNGGAYGNEDSTRLTSPTIDLSYSSAHPYLEITHSYETEYLWDGGSIFLSLDGGASFDYTKSISVLSGKQYDSIMAGSAIADTLLPGKWAFTGSSGGEVVTQFDLTPAAYKSKVAIQFVFESNHYNTANGWEIRKIKLMP